METIITPERADIESKALMDLIAAVASPDSDNFELAETAMIHAFSFTTAHEEALRAFAGGPMDRFLKDQEPVDLECAVA